MINSKVGPDFVYNTLSDKKNWTEDIVAGLVARAFVAPKPSLDTCRKMAIKFLWILKRSKTGWLPKLSCVDLTTTGAALTRKEEQMTLDEVREKWDVEPVRTTKRKRHFKSCPGCGHRFLAKRGNQTACSVRCRNRAYRLKRGLPVRYKLGFLNS